MSELANLLTRAKLKGSNANFRAWVQRQPSAISGTYSEYLESGEGRSVAAHESAAERFDERRLEYLRL